MVWFRSVETAAVAQLDRGTKLVRRWNVRYYGTCGEFAAWVSARPDPDGRGSACFDDAGARAARRARTQIRRYCTHNGITRLLTLTFTDEHLPPTRRAAFAEARAFVRRLRLHGINLGAYVVVVERGGRTGRLHVHIGYGRYLPAPTVAAVWNRGWVDLRSLLRADAARGHRSASAVAARYLAKYAAKALEENEERATGEHRYEVGQGFQPTYADGECSSDELARIVSHAEWCLSYLDHPGERPTIPWVIARGLWSMPPPTDTGTVSHDEDYAKQQRAGPRR